MHHKGKGNVATNQCIALVCSNISLNQLFTSAYAVRLELYILHTIYYILQRFVLFCADMEKDNFFTPARFEQKLFYPRKCVTCDKSEFATKQRKMCLTTSMSKIRLPHIYRSNNYVIIKKNPLLTAIFKNLPNKNP